MSDKKLKIAYLCEFSHPSICGVWNRVYHTAKEMVKRGHEVYVFSSNIIKSTEKTSQSYELLEGIYIHRFPVKLSFGENALFWKFKEDLIQLKPDVIDAQVHRHPHSTFAPKIARKVGAKSVLTTHAPFVERELRGKLLNLAVNSYDFIFGKKVLRSYDKVIAITKWEIPYLKASGCNMSKVSIIPNGIDSRFLKIKYTGNKNHILFFGRIAPIKDLETLIRAFSKLDSKTKLFLAGPWENDYKTKLDTLISQSGVKNRVIFTGPIYNFEKKKKLFSECGIFVLPSKREGLPQSLLEAMAAGKIVISSSNKGGKELIKDENNGFIFEIGNVEDLTTELSDSIKNFTKLGKVRKAAKKTASEMTWGKIGFKLQNVYISS